MRPSRLLKCYPEMLVRCARAAIAGPCTARFSCVCVLIPTLRLKSLFVAFRTDRSNRSTMLLLGPVQNRSGGWGSINGSLIIADVPRDKYVSGKATSLRLSRPRRTQKRGASFVNNKNARPDCELPHHLAALGALLMRNDALGWKALMKSLGDDFALVPDRRFFLSRGRFSRCSAARSPHPFL